MWKQYRCWITTRRCLLFSYNSMTVFYSLLVCISCIEDSSESNLSRVCVFVCVRAGTSPQLLHSAACASAVSRSWPIFWARSAQERGSYWPSPSSTSISRSSLRSRAKSAASEGYSSKLSATWTHTYAETHPNQTLLLFLWVLLLLFYILFGTVSWSGPFWTARFGFEMLFVGGERERERERYLWKTLEQSVMNKARLCELWR